MLTLEKIREDLREIRYYYSRRDVFDTAIRGLGLNEVLDKVRRYNLAVQSAPPKLYDLYISLYVKNYTQEGVAMEMGYAPEHVRRLNKQLLLHLQSKLHEEG